MRRLSLLDKISFDHAVVEAEKSISVIPCKGTWKDIGTWNTLTEVMDELVLGDDFVADTCDNVHILNLLKKAGERIKSLMCRKS